jgi:hypothetical protein
MPGALPLNKFLSVAAMMPTNTGGAAAAQALLDSQQEDDGDDQPFVLDLAAYDDDAELGK